jgi:hypothetical protein
MPASHDSRSPQVLGRLIAGGVLNLILLLMVPRLAMWSSIDREFRMALIAASVGVLAIVWLVPVLWRGKTWQPVTAIMLMVCPAISLYLPVDFLFHYR